jgi:hypothetical protein
VDLGAQRPTRPCLRRKGSLYVSESGVAGEGPAGLTRTGRVSKYGRGSTEPSWTTEFESVFAQIDPSQPADVLGPEGISALAGSCSNDGDHRSRNDRRTGRERDRCQVRLIMSESHDGVAAITGGAVSTRDAGILYGLDAATGRATSVSDVGDQQYKWTSDHVDVFPSDFPDSNPFGVLVTRDRKTHQVRTFVADAGANTRQLREPRGRKRCGHEDRDRR